MVEKEKFLNLRTSERTCKKLDYIADYHGRSRTGEINWVLRQHILEFERANGAIVLQEEETAV